ncbi:MAG: efflux RND transporter periplasmic adaptor subunit [Alistipes sp.]|nr:efflux RND transporter periplasmic adaptor subunit [Alistipes sp.]
MKINLRNAFVAGVVAFCACVCASCAEEQKSTTRNREYDVMVLEPTSRKLTSVYSASIRGKQDIDIRPKVSGYITDIYVKEGAIVKKGQTLFVIDQVPYEAELQTAIANVDVAQASVDAAELTTNSKERLFEQKIISDFELRMAKTTLASERATLAQAKAKEVNARNNLSYTLVKSPADGVLGTLPFRVGTLVSPSDATPMTSVSDNSEMYVYFSMNESQVLSLTRRHGSLEQALQQMPSIELLLSDGTIYSEKGRIESISGIIDQTTGSVSIRARFPNYKRLLLSGGSGNVILPHRQEGCVVIPQSATYEIQDKIYAYKVVNGVAKSQIVSVFEISNGKEYVVESGLMEGDTIVVEGVGLLRDGMNVKIKNVVKGE